MRTLFAPLVLAAAALLGSRAAQAGHYVEVEVVDRDTGQVATVHAHDGQYWLAGTPGHRYAVRLQNRSGERVLAVLSVDGVNAVSGQTASAQQTGYVLGPWQTTEVAGWRKSLHDIAQFEFTAISDSYAARTGRPQNVGVIGVAVFRERAPRWRHYDDAVSKQEAPAGAAPRAQAERDAAAGARSAPQPVLGATAPPAEAKLGTGHGAREWSQARQVGFERDSAHPVEVHALRYDSERNLVAMGVIPPPWRHPHPRHTPDPFPIGFVPDP
jgi:hypothetical protein